MGQALFIPASALYLRHSPTFHQAPCRHYTPSTQFLWQNSNIPFIPHMAAGHSGPCGSLCATHHLAYHAHHHTFAPVACQPHSPPVHLFTPLLFGTLFSSSGIPSTCLTEHCYQRLKLFLYFFCNTKPVLTARWFIHIHSWVLVVILQTNTYSTCLLPDISIYGLGHIGRC